MTVNDIFLLLKSSDKINHDLTYPFEYCEDTTDDDTEGVTITLALQRFAKLKPISEFRCFVRDGMFIAFCSRDTAFHQNLPDKMDDLQPKIERFIEEEVIPNFELKSFVVDVYWKLDGTFYIFDFRNRFAIYKLETETYFCNLCDHILYETGQQPILSSNRCTLFQLGRIEIDE